jgi:hypothetical protein
MDNGRDINNHTAHTCGQVHRHTQRFNRKQIDEEKTRSIFNAKVAMSFSTSPVTHADSDNRRKYQSWLSLSSLGSLLSLSSRVLAILKMTIWRQQLPPREREREEFHSCDDPWREEDRRTQGIVSFTLHAHPIRTRRLMSWVLELVWSCSIQGEEDEETSWSCRWQLEIGKSVSSSLSTTTASTIHPSSS